MKIDSIIPHHRAALCVVIRLAFSFVPCRMLCQNAYHQTQTNHCPPAHVMMFDAVASLCILFLGDALSLTPLYLQPGEMVFKLLRSMLEEVAAAAAPSTTDTTDDMSILDASAPRPDQLPMGASRNTWPNIVNNKRSIIFCTTQFTYLKNRENCIHDFTGGPLLA